MATIIERRQVDDLDGSPADGSLSFTVNGERYEMDLSKDNARAFHADMERWIKAARKVGKAPGVKKVKSHTPVVKIDDTQAAPIRAWATGRDQDELRKMARSTGLSVPDRGRLSIGVLTAAYNVAHPTKRTAVQDPGGIPTDIVDRGSELFSAV